MIYFINYSAAGTKAEDARIQRNLSKRLLEFAVRHETGLNSADFTMCFGEHGKPYLKDSGIHFNITNCKGLICCAVEKTEVGIDAETRRVLNPRIFRACTEAEQRHISASSNPDFTFLKLWTLKESYMKYTGMGLAFGTLNAEFTYNDGKPVYVGKTEMPIYVSQSILELGGEPYIVSLCSGEEITPDFHEVKESEL